MAIAAVSRPMPFPTTNAPPALPRHAPLLNTPPPALPRHTRLLNAPPPPPKQRVPPTTKWERKSIPPPKMKKGEVGMGMSMATPTDVLQLMDSLQLPIQPDMYSSLLKECTYKRDAMQGARVHSHMLRSRFPLTIPLANRLLLMYVVSHRLPAARALFHQMTLRNSISWATLIVGHAQNDDHRQVLQLFRQSLQQADVDGLRHPLPATTLYVLRACTHGDYFELGEQVHGWLCKLGLTQDVLLGASLLGFYAKFGCPDSARRVFDQMPRRGSILWTSMIVGYCREEQYREAVDVFREMGIAGKKKGCFAFSSVLGACGRLEDKGVIGAQVHGQAIKVGVERNGFVQSSLVDMYGKQGLVEEAAAVFEMIAISERDVVSWNAMLMTYTRGGRLKEAIRLLYEMKAAGVEPPESTVNQVLSCF